MDTTELQNQAIEIRDAENEGENTALRVGTMLLAIIDAFANIVDLDTLQQILEQYAGTTGSGQIYWRHARCVFLASMGAELDAVNGDGWEYTNHNGDIVFNPTSKNLRVVGETGSYFVYTNVLYVHAHTSHAYKWDAAEQKMVEITDTNLPAVITYKNTPAFSQVAIGESYVFQSQSSGPKIAIKISSSETYSFLPDPKKIYAFRDIRQAMLWKPSNQTWVSLTPRVINDLTTGGEGDALSAEMGKTLMVAIQQILGALGNYAFPGGKPTIDWGGSSSVTYTVTYPSDSKVTHSGAGDTVEPGSLLEVTLGIASGNGLYAIKDSSVKVYMGGVEQSGAYNASTQKVKLAAVTGNVVIVAEAWTYVSRGLVMHLDGRNRGGTAGKWKSLVDYNSNPLYFKLENCDEQSDYVAGNGTNSKGTAFSNSELTTPVTLLDVGAAEGTIEAAYSHAEITSNGALLIMHNAIGSGNRICLTSIHFSNNGSNDNTVVFCTAPGIEQTDLYTSAIFTKASINNGGSISCTASSIKIDGVASDTKGRYNQAANENSLLSLFCRTTSNDLFSKLRLYALRVYSVQLTDAERAQNLAIDQKRFNLS